MWSQLTEMKNAILNLNLFPLHTRHALLVVALTHSERDVHLRTCSPQPLFDEMRNSAHGNLHDCTPRCALERIFLLVNLNENGLTIG